MLEEKARQDAEAQERAVHEFELTQAGFDGRNGRGGAARTGALRREGSQQSPAPSVATPSVATPQLGESEKRGEKRKFSFNEDEVARIAEEERAKARKAIDDEKVGTYTIYLSQRGY